MQVDSLLLLWSEKVRVSVEWGRHGSTDGGILDSGFGERVAFLFCFKRVASGRLILILILLGPNPTPMSMWAGVDVF